MFFKFAAWNKGATPVINPDADWIEALFRLHSRTLLEALDIFFATRTLPAGYPDYGTPADLRPTAIGAPQLLSGIINSNKDEPFDHLAYAYLVENTRAFEIFDRVIREYEAGERFETPDPDTALWIRTTVDLFYRDLPSGTVMALSNWLRRDLRAVRRNAYYRLLGLDLNHGMDGNRAYPYDKPQAANRDFVPAFEAFLREVWRGIANQANAVGPNETDNAAIADHVRRLREMLRIRRNNGNLLLEEYVAVATMGWFHLTLMADTPVVRALKAEAASPGDRLRKIGERVGVPAHARSDSYFSMAFSLSNLLSFIEWDKDATDPSKASAYYMASSPHPQIVGDLRTIITHWSIATGRDIKAVSVAPPPAGRPAPQLVRPGPVPMLTRTGEMTG